MKRDPLGKFFLLVLVMALAGLAAVTRFPDAWWVDKVTKAAVIGPWIDRIAQLYRRPSGAVVESDHDGGVEVAYEIDFESHEARPTIVVEDGTTLFAEASDSSRRLGSLPGANLELLDRRGDWYEVGHRGQKGWVFLPQRQATSPPLGSQPALPLPVPSRSPDPEVLAAALELLGTSKHARTLGPYTLYSDVEDRGLLIYLSAVAAQLETVYIKRYGLAPLPGDREAVVLLSSEASYLRFLEKVQPLPEVSAPGVVRSGVVATYLEGRGWSEVSSTLIHELTHLLNRRAIGPALPPWLEEGLADDLAQSRIEGLRILPGTLGGSSARTGALTEYKGGQAAAIELGRAVEADRLPPLRTLVRLDWEAFQHADHRSLRYGQSSFFVRSLIDSSDPGLAAAFRGFLQEVSEGGPVTAEALRERLSRSWESLDSRLVSFVRLQAVDPGLPASGTSGSSSRQASEPSS